YEYAIVGDWWTIVFPGFALMIFALGMNLLGDGLRDALDPRLRR
ncbi:MAG: ABC transporter permease, partial [Thermoplasmata archaeon]